MADASGNDTVREEIARRAYKRFCDRGCAHGADRDDWLAAEGEVIAEQQTVEQQVVTADSPARLNRKPRR